MPEKDPQKLDLALRRHWLQRLLDPVVVLFGRLLLIVLGPVRVRNRWRVPRHGGVLVVANHRSDIDPILVQLACLRHVSFMAKHELFEMPSIAWFMRYWGAFPVRRGEPDRSSLKFAIEQLKAGVAVGIFPEGQLSETGEMLPILPGVALIVRQAEVPVLPVGIVNATRIMPYGKVVPRPAFGGVRCNVGEPRSFSKSDSPEDILAWIDSELRRLSASEA